MGMPAGMEWLVILILAILFFGGQVFGLILTFYRQYESITERLLWILLIFWTGWLGVLLIYLLKKNISKSNSDKI